MAFFTQAAFNSLNYLFLEIEHHLLSRTYFLALDLFLFKAIFVKNVTRMSTAATAF